MYLDRNHDWQTVFPFLLPSSTKRKNCRCRNSVLQHGYIPKLLTLKANAQYVLKILRKKFRFEETLDKDLKQHRQQDHKIAIRLYKHKTKSHKFCFSVFKNLLYDSKNYEILTFTCLVLRAHFRQSHRRSGVQTP